MSWCILFYTLTIYMFRTRIFINKTLVLTSMCSHIWVGTMNKIKYLPVFPSDWLMPAYHWYVTCMSLCYTRWHWHDLTLSLWQMWVYTSASYRRRVAYYNIHAVNFAHFLGVKDCVVDIRKIGSLACNKITYTRKRQMLVCVLQFGLESVFRFWSSRTTAFRIYKSKPNHIYTFICVC